ncbi:MAG: hypothetical protein V4724_30570 [Pseudomonadota bacterium]
MKKLLSIAIIAALIVFIWHGLDGGGMHVNLDGDEIGGPLGTLLGMLFAGGGLIVGAIAIVCAAVFVGFLFAGLGLLMVFGLTLLAVLLAALVAPFTLPLLIPAAIAWFIISRRNRAKHLQMKAMQEQPV